MMGAHTQPRFFRLTKRLEEGRFVHYAEMNCDRCAGPYKIKMRTNFPDELVRKSLQADGWLQIGRDRFICNTCVQARNSKPNERSAVIKRDQTPMQVNGTTSPTPKVQLHPQNPTPAQMRKIVEALALYFDDKTKQYTGGYTDDRVAKEISVPVEWVRDFRREAFGEISLPPEIASMKDQLLEISKKVAAMEHDLDKVVAQAASISKNIEAWINRNK